MKRRALLLFACGFAAIAPAFAQPEAPPKESVGFAERHEVGLKVVNFAILAIGLGYLIRKNAGPFFDARSRKIRKAMIEAADARKEAEARIMAVESRLANLGVEIAALREESQKEATAEHEQVARLTDAEVAKIRTHAEQEIAAAGKAARMELRRYTARLAVDLAEAKIRTRMTPAAQNALVEGFVTDLPKASSNS